MIKRYLMLSIPLIGGVLLFSLGVYNIVSSLLFFVGGYFFIKNLFDYRKIVKCKHKIEERKNNNFKGNFNMSNSVIGLKRTHRYERVRKRVKEE